MSRSSKKVPFVAPELMKRIEAMNAENKKALEGTKLLSNAFLY